MKHLVETSGDVGGCVGLRGPEMDPSSEFSRKARDIEETLRSGAEELGEFPDSLDVKLLIAKQIAAVRISLLLKSTGFSIAGLARVIGIPRETLSKIYHQRVDMSHADYQRLGKAELVLAIATWAERQDAKQYEFFMQTLDSIQHEVPLSDTFARTLYSLSAAFGATAWQSFVDGHGTMTSIPAKENCPGELARRLRAEGAA